MFLHLLDCTLLSVEDYVWTLSLILASTEGPDEDEAFIKYWLKYG